MQRRDFFRHATTAAVAAPIAGGPLGEAAAEREVAAPTLRGSFAVDDNRVRFFTPAVKQRLSVLVVADTHLFTDDQRGAPYRQFSARMAGAYNQTRHFQTGEPTNPAASFIQTLRLAEESEVDLVALVGDIFSFPAEAAIEWVGRRLADIEVPYLYVAGNHDWHYEGMAGSLASLRSTWIEQRLKPLYQGRHPLMAVVELGGVRLLAIDNSHYEIEPAQLEFFRSQVASGQPLLLFVHIPLYATGRPLGFGCGHPDWGAANDRNYELERRPRWAASGHSRVTLDFHREVFAAPNLLGIFAGHIHRQSIDVVQGIPQFVTDANATGAYMAVEFLPAAANTDPQQS